MKMLKLLPILLFAALLLAGCQEKNTITQQQDAEQTPSQEIPEEITPREALPGEEMEMECVLLDGNKLNLKDLKGKVVLVDFWATWCPPCVAEVPNMLANYEKYHDDGFEIIGYSADKDLDALKKFQEKQQLPWHIGVRQLSTDANLTDYLAYYGVDTIPRMILVDRNGKIVSAHARGEVLTQELEKIFGH